MNFKENNQYFCPACGREVIEFPLHRQDLPIEHENQVWHDACLGETLVDGAIMQEKENG